MTMAANDNPGGPSYREWIAAKRAEAIERGGTPIKPPRTGRLPKGLLTVPRLANQMGMSTRALHLGLEKLGWTGKAVGWRNRRLLNSHPWETGPVYYDTYRLTADGIRQGVGVTIRIGPHGQDAMSIDMITPDGQRRIREAVAETAPIDADAPMRKRAGQIIQLRAAGMSQRGIASEVGCSLRLVSNVLKAAA